MKLPFLKIPRAADAKPSQTVTYPIHTPDRKLSDTVRLTEPVVTSVRPTPANAPRVSNAPDIPLAVGLILHQLPAQLLVAGAEAQLQGATIAIPSEFVLSQLPTGKVSLKLSDLVPLLPSDLVQKPLTIALAQHSVSLPLPEVIAAMPQELLVLRNESTIELDDTPAGDFAALLDNTSAAAAAPPQPDPPAVKPVVPVRPALDPSETTCFAISSGTKAPLTISTRSLLAVMPDNVFAARRADLCRQVAPDARVPIPMDLVTPQLATGQISLPLSKAIEALPASLFTRPLPAIDGKVIPLPVQEIVSQLPVEYFVNHLKQTRQQNVELDEKSIPTPFEERQIVTTPRTTQLAVPAPVAAEPVSPAELEDESFELFSEKSPEPMAPVEFAVPAPEPVISEAPTDPLPAHNTGFLVDLNRCTAAELLKLHGVGPALAQRIVDYRNQHGGFHSLEELRQVPGVGRKTFRAVTGPEPQKLNRLLNIDHDRELSLQEIVAAIAAMRGVEGCLLTMDDGLLLTGHVPAPLESNAVSALAPQLFKKMERYTRELEVGHVRHITIFTEQKPMSIFHAGSTYLVVVHHARRYNKALSRRCQRVSQELARMCRQRAVV